MGEIKRISLRELHERTGTLIREASTAGYTVVVTDRGKPLATITPYSDDVERRRFRDREMSSAFRALQRREPDGDSTHDVSDDRDRGT
jgi:prevent-host-death family protein